VRGEGAGGPEGKSDQPESIIRRNHEAEDLKNPNSVIAQVFKELEYIEQWGSSNPNFIALPVRNMKHPYTFSIISFHEERKNRYDNAL